MADYKIWLSYDLGLAENAAHANDQQYQKRYQKRYRALMDWLAKYQCMECGKSVALLDCSIEDGDDYIRVLKNELTSIGIKEEDGVRIYAIISDKLQISYSDIEETIPTQRILFAGFIIGERLQAPWEEGAPNGYPNTDVYFK